MARTSPRLTRSPALPLPPAPRAPSLPPLDPPGAVYTPEETERHLQLVESLLMLGAADEQVVRGLRERAGVPRARAVELLARLRAAWAEERERTDRDAHRDAMVKRMQRVRTLAQGEKDQATGKWTLRPDLNALLAVERFQADLLGLRAPIEVRVDVRVQQAVLHVISGLTPEAQQRYLDEARETRRLAELGRALGAADRPATTAAPQLGGKAPH